ncbi:hypothetical protein [Actinoplanes utahensis]|uniref:hypothetical protein n=1 Tax=Actinoplanes utahensis TaxID=1869 RepID=UPI001269B776|nr:hypothetical protein [Actinoplanes utahensis]GIF32192.1 hypothetical protein Aut01nite_51780 [Actinoplanes utahensis]
MRLFLSLLTTLSLAGASALVAGPAAAATGARTVDGIYELIESTPELGSTAGHQELRFLREADGDRIRLDGPDEVFDELVPGQRASVTGQQTASALRAGEAHPLSVAETPQVTGEETLAVVLLRLGPSGGQPMTAAEVRQSFFTAPDSVSAYFRESSWSQLDLRGDVIDYLEVPADTGCWAEATAGETAVRAAGLDLSGYDRIEYLIDGGARNCGYGGWAWIGGQLSVNIYQGEPAVRAVAHHELGHNFGLYHAHALRCRATGGGYTVIEDGPACETDEYGDPFDSMGAAYDQMQFSAYTKNRLGWIPDARVTTITADGTYPVAPSEADTDAPQSLRIPLSDGRFYDIDFRRPYGEYWDARVADNPALMNGVSLRRVLGPDSSLLDTTADGWFHDAPLQVGSTFTDTANGVTIRTESVSATEARVRVSFAGDVQQVHLRGTANGWGATAMTRVPGTPHDWTVQADFGSGADERFKFDIFGDWSENYGDHQGDGIADRDGADIPVTGGAGRYTIDFNSKTRVYAVRFTEPAHNHPSMNVRGTAHGWTTTPMTLTADHTWTATVRFESGGAERFKFDVDGTWATNFGDNDTDGIADPDGADITLPRSGTWKLTFNDETRRYTATLT